MSKRELRVKCYEKYCDNLASGIFRIIKGNGEVEAGMFCGPCGMYHYVKRRAVFDPDLRLELVRALNTLFVQSQTKSTCGADKHWVEHVLPEEHVFSNGKTGSEILAQRRGGSTVHPSLLEQYKRY